MHRVLVCCLLMLLGLVPSARAQEAPAAALIPPPPYFESAEQDGKGGIWAFSRAESNTLFFFDDKQWSARPVLFKEGGSATPVQMARMNDGAVACVWHLDREQMAVTRHLGKESTLLMQGAGTVSNGGQCVPALVDSQNRLWIMGANAAITRVNPQGGAPFTYGIRAEDLLKPDKADPAGKENWNPLYATEDGRGRVWVWSRTLGMEHPSLRGVLVIDGDKVERRDITGILGTQFSLLTRKDERHLWLGVERDGLYEVDIDTLQAQRVLAPDTEAFRWVDSVFAVEGDLYAVSKTRAESTLWRQRGGQWEKLAEGFDRGMDLRAWTPVSDGFLFYAQPTPWFIGKKTPPTRLDWRNGFPVEGVNKLLKCTDGRFFGIGRNGAIFHQTLVLPPNPPTASRAVPLDLRRDWALATDDHLWALPKAKPVLQEWDGAAWLEYEFPFGVKPSGIESLAADQAGRIWLLPNSNERVAAYFDSHEKKWRTFPKIEAAFEALKSDPPLFSNPHRWFNIPQYSAQRDRIAFRSQNWQLAYFDGTAWFRWKHDEIAGSGMLGVPFFDASDLLCVNVGKATWQFDGHGGWQQTIFENRFPTDEFSGSYHGPPRIDPPPACITDTPDSIVLDNRGIAWFTWKGALYKCSEDLCFPVFAEGEPNPFTARRRLLEVWVDRGGTAFVKTAANIIEWLQIAPKNPPPQTMATVVPTAQDAVCVKWQARSASKLRFRWRLDDEPWQWTEQGAISLEALPSGPHAVQVQAFDEELQSDAAPVAAQFKIQIDPARQIEAFIAQLSHPDYARRIVAVRALARQPEWALPALKAARETANDDQRWWIDAALQQIERKRAASLVPSPR